MADVDRKARIAAARKKLKQIQRCQTPSTSQSAVGGDSNHVKNDFTNNEAGDINSSFSTKEEPIMKGLESLRRSSLDDSKSSPSNKMTPDHLVQSSNVSNASSTEKINSLSRQVTESMAYLNGDISIENNLEHHEGSQELGDRLEKMSQNNNLLQSQLEEMKQHNAKLQNSMESERKTFEEKLKKDLGALKEQLQVHVQTVGILVAEKTELQFACNQATKLAETRQAEVEELAGRLKASRQRVTDLEKNLSTSNSTNQKLDRSNKELTKDLDKIKMEIYKNNKSREELQQHNLELQGRLQQKMHEMTKLEDDNIELKGKLEMSELYLEQLKNGQDRPDSNVTKQIEKILTEKTELQTKLQQQEDAVKLISRERESMVIQYNQYIEQLQQQNKDLQQQIEKLLREKDSDSMRIEDMETSLNQLKSKQAEVTDDRIQEHEEKSRLMETVENLMSQLMAASKNLEVQMADNSQLSRLVIEKEQTILELEQQLERVSCSTADQDKLIETMQSDKTALSRAMAQNKELKAQFLELQEQFVKMSQKNMDVMTKLQGEEHNTRELQQKYCNQEEELKQLRNLLDEKSRSLEEMDRKRMEEQRRKDDRQVLMNGLDGTPDGSAPSSEDENHEMENKKLAELFQRKAPLLENLQKELSSAQDTINALTNQNSELRTKVASLETSPPITSIHLDDVVGRALPKVDLLKTTITQLEMEKQQVSEQLKESVKMQNILKDKMDAMHEDLARQAPATLNGDIVTRVHFEALQHAMQQLEEKYTRTMRDKAELVDKIERLEHIILQLQGETDTIGEYVSLYHQQRYLMRQRTAEKDCHISRLSSERSELQGKFRQLQALVVQLLKERSLSSSSSSPPPLPSTYENVLSADVVPRDVERVEGEVSTSEKKKDGREGEGGEDWPDYSESSDEDNQQQRSNDSLGMSSTSDTIFIDQSPSAPKHSPPLSPSKGSPLKAINIPGNQSDNTVLKIMNLLNEIDNSTNSDELLRIPFFCPNCTGDVLVV